MSAGDIDRLVARAVEIVAESTRGRTHDQLRSAGATLVAQGVLLTP
ncbi:hypothetical protein MOQ72_38100 [Saccharopolyspora sp. K220]|nr:hypothetical protein [Saccharopolyspora soli]MCI2423249.1 hypothetical protein [Saccharopolyspora soli]